EDEQRALEQYVDTCLMLQSFAGGFAQAPYAAVGLDRIGGGHVSSSSACHIAVVATAFDTTPRRERLPTHRRGTPQERLLLPDGLAIGALDFAPAVTNHVGDVIRH